MRPLSVLSKRLAVKNSGKMYALLIQTLALLTHATGLSMPACLNIEFFDHMGVAGGNTINFTLTDEESAPTDSRSLAVGLMDGDSNVDVVVAAYNDALASVIPGNGDGTMSCAGTFVEKGINCIGVPKTIDNDLVGTDVTFGFNTAVNVATEALDRIHTTAASHHLQ